MDIDLGTLRQALIDYYGTAAENMPVAYVSLSQVEEASADELVEMAIVLGWIQG